MEVNYASKGVGGAGLGLGIAGTALGLMNNSGGLGNLLGGGCGYTEKQAELAAKIASLETEVKLRDANTFTMGEMSKLRDYFERRIDHVEHELCDQKVYNATNTATISCISGQVAQLMSLTKLVVPNASICPGWDTTSTT